MKNESIRVNFTKKAAEQTKKLIKSEKNLRLFLRLYIVGGGCSGFQYGFTLDENKNDDDITVMREGVTLVIDSLSFQYLKDSEIDYYEDVQKSNFVVRNPSAKNTCGCGSSFSI